MKRIDELNALGMKLIGVSEELKNYVKDITKHATSIAFGLYRGEIDAEVADTTLILIREAKWRLEMLEKKMMCVMQASGADVVEQMTMPVEEEEY